MAGNNLSGAEMVKRFQDFFENHYSSKLLSLNPDQKFIEVSFNDISLWDMDIANELLDNPEEVIKAADLSLEKNSTFPEPRDIVVRIIKLPSTQSRNVWEVRNTDIGPFIALKGIINKCSAVSAVCKEARFECPSCGSIINVLQLDERFKEPSKCGCGRKGKFTLLNKVMMDTIKIGLIDDLMEKENKDRGIAREKLTLLSGPLTSLDIDKMIKIGKKVLLNGYFKYIQKGQSNEFDTLFIVNSIEFIEVGWDTIKVTEQEAEQIEQLAKQDDIIDRLADSIADIEGYHEAKVACLLLLTGAPNIYDTNNFLDSRGTIHVLLIGNPGASKTQLAKRAGSISPIYSFEAANTSSGKGLVAAVVQDKDIGGYILTPGPVIKASNGVAVIDEIDKTDEDDYGQHNHAMNDMVVPIARANINARLEAKTSYLATANPKNRVFTSFEDKINQIDMPKDFLDRFDLILAMIPSQDVMVQKKIIITILSRNLQTEKKQWNPEFSHDFIKQYIAYCRRKNPRPELPLDLFPYITEKVIELMKPKGDEQTKVSFRQVESITRFSFAAARLRLRDITQVEADRAISLKRKSFIDLNIIDESGTFRWNVEEHIDERKISDDKEILDVLRQMLPDIRTIIAIQDLVEECKKKGVAEDKVEEYIEKKKRVGDLMETRRGFLQKVG